MAEPHRIEITREKFEAQWGIIPPAESQGARIVTSSKGIVEYVFVGKAQEEIATLERLYKK